MGYKIVLFLFTISFSLDYIIAAEKELLFVNVIFRHGDRTPVDPYPTDPYKDLKYWPTGWGQLTNKGKKQHFALGQWLRTRYTGFLPEKYSLNDIYVRATDVDRTLMSAESNLAGLYPPKTGDVWNPTVEWQPIPVHTVPESDDALLAAKKSCPRYEVEMKKLLASPEFQKYNEELSPIFKYVTNHTGREINDIQELEYLYNTLYIESLYGFQLPNWTKSVYPDKMKPWAEFSFKLFCYNQRLARLKMGLLLNEIVSRFVSKSKNRLVPDRKMWIYSAHDTTIANVLMMLGAFDSHCPPYASTIILELFRKNGNFYVSAFYKNDTVAHPISILGCNMSCPLTDVLNLLQPVMLNYKQWDLECHSLSAPMVSTIAAIAVISCGVLLLLLLVSLCVGATCSRKKRNNQFYQPLAHEEAGNQNSATERDWLFKNRTRN